MTAFSSTPDKEQEARSFGAHHFAASTSKSELEKAGKVDFILSTVFADLQDLIGGEVQRLVPHGPEGQRRRDAGGVYRGYIFALD